MRVVPRFLPTRRSSVFVVLLLWASGPLTPNAVAQDRGTFELTALVGVASFLNEPADPTTTEDGSRVHFVFEQALGVGLRLGLNFGDAVGFDADMLYVPTEFSAVDGSMSGGLEANVYIVGGTLRIMLPPIGGGDVEPFGAVGAGVKGYDGLIGTHTDAMWSIGGGVYVPVGTTLDVRLELRDYMSRFDGAGDTRFQNDLLFTVGLVLF